MRRALLCLLLLAAGPAPAPTRGHDALRSGHQDASPEVQAMQDDDTANPAMLWVQQGEALWDQPAGSSGRSCAGCHGGIAFMRGVAVRYPAYDPALGRPVLLEQRVNQSRTAHQGAPPFEADNLLAMTALIGLQSRGMPLSVDTAGPAARFAAAGEALFRTRMGQLNLSCAQCHGDLGHDGLASQRLGGAHIPQGHPNGYPLYRLEWQSMGSLYRRLRNCMVGVRAEPFGADSAERVALEFYLAARANGLPVETPGVRP